MQHPIQPSDRLTFSDFTVLVLHHMIVFLVLQSCAGQTQVIGPSQPIVATVGDDIILPCHLEPAINASDLRLEWVRPDLSPGFVHVRANSQESVVDKQPSYRGRTSLLTDKLKDGDISLRLSEVKPSDEGTYRCLAPTLGRAAFIKLIVGAVSSPFIKVINRNGTNVVLQCESKGWYPEPEVSWLDGEGNLLSAGPTKTVRGPDDLYTVSSRVTVEKRHDNNVTCRVQQKNINQTRETHIIVSALPWHMKCILALSLAGVFIVILSVVGIEIKFTRYEFNQDLNEVTTQKTDVLLEQETAATEKRPAEDKLPASAQEV
ncbi:butyrophilin subfamily 2 member A2-like isoform X2 [Thunnus maccoyii]|uniref:butyrophilin subfamily 2 member A2-like isoform X2 n=1 Tax=Thunnus maccoyii TaxID=8240 RepID=UPI001C4CB50A|nr:butyrophilin subfamily 2 member A2-like isoform X2 [Thunnus maccoyii]